MFNFNQSFCVKTEAHRTPPMLVIGREAVPMRKADEVTGRRHTVLPVPRLRERAMFIQLRNADYFLNGFVFNCMHRAAADAQRLKSHISTINRTSQWPFVSSESPLSVQ